MNLNPPFIPMAFFLWVILQFFYVMICFHDHLTYAGGLCFNWTGLREVQITGTMLFLDVSVNIFTEEISI